MKDRWYLLVWPDPYKKVIIEGTLQNYAVKGKVIYSTYTNHPVGKNIRFDSDSIRYEPEKSDREFNTFEEVQAFILVEVL